MSYREVNTIADVLAKVPVVLGFDTETQGLDYKSPNGVLISYSISWAPGDAYQIFLHHETSEAGDFKIKWERQQWWGQEKQLTDVLVKKADEFDLKLAELRRIMEDPDILLLMHHGTFDIHWVEETFRRYGQEPPTVRGYVMDTQIAAQLIDDIQFGRASLKKVRDAFLGAGGNWKEGMKNYKGDMLAAPRDELTAYACEDADVTRQVGLILKDRLGHLPAVANYFTRFAQPITSNLLYRLEGNGARMAVDRLPKIKAQLAETIHKEYHAALELVPVHIMEKHGDKAVLTRNEFIADVLYDGFDIPVTEKTPGGARKTDKKLRKVLKESPKTPKAARDFMTHFDEWAETQGFLSRYLKQFEECCAADLRLHPNYCLCKARTGRVSTTDPNLMNLPKRSKLSTVVRELIKAEEGNVLLSFDVSQSELRWLAHISRDPEMCRVYQNGEDIHTNTARSIVGAEWTSISDELKKQRRKEAKSLNFGLIYGMQAPTFVKYAKQDYGITLKLEQAQEWIETFFDTYKGIRPYHHAAVKFCREHGYVTTPFGRRRLIPHIKSNDFRKRSDAERQAINTPIQGVSSDAFLLAWYYLLQVPEASRLRPILFVHDDLIVEAPDDPGYLKEIIPVIKHHLVHPPIQELFGFTPIVPFEVDGSIGYSLAEMKALEE